MVGNSNANVFPLYASSTAATSRKTRWVGGCLNLLLVISLAVLGTGETMSFCRRNYQKVFSSFLQTVSQCVVPTPVSSLPIRKVPNTPINKYSETGKLLYSMYPVCMGLLVLNVWGCERLREPYRLIHTQKQASGTFFCELRINNA